jgi:hypothetical protein
VNEPAKNHTQKEMMSKWFLRVSAIVRTKILFFPTMTPSAIASFSNDFCLDKISVSHIECDVDEAAFG